MFHHISIDFLNSTQENNKYQLVRDATSCLKLLKCRTYKLMIVRWIYLRLYFISCYVYIFWFMFFEFGLFFRIFWALVWCCLFFCFSLAWTNPVRKRIALKHSINIYLFFYPFIEKNKAFFCYFSDSPYRDIEIEWLRKHKWESMSSIINRLDFA